MDFFKLFYFFTQGPKMKLFRSAYFQHGPCLGLSFLVLAICVTLFIWWFYYSYTNKNVTKTATKKNFILKAWCGGMIACIILSELVFALWSKIPNANILQPFIGDKNYNVLLFCLINGCLYYSLFFGIFSFLFKGKSKNASLIWFF